MDEPAPSAEAAEQAAAVSASAESEVPAAQGPLADDRWLDDLVELSQEQDAEADTGTARESSPAGAQRPAAGASLVASTALVLAGALAGATPCGPVADEEAPAGALCAGRFVACGTR